MEFRKMVMMTLYARLQKRQNRLLDSGRGRRRDDFRERHWNMYITICEIDHQSRFDAWDRVLRASALGWPRGMERGGRWDGGSEWGTHVHPWLIHVNAWQKPPQYCKVISLQEKNLLWAKLCMCLSVHPTLCNPKNYNLPGSSVHGIIPERIVE